MENLAASRLRQLMLLGRWAPEAVRYPATPRTAHRLAHAQSAGQPTATLRQRPATRVIRLHARNPKSLV